MEALLNPTSLVSSFGYVAIFLLSVAQSCCIPTSSELTLGFAGALAATGHLHLDEVILAGVAGELVGAYLAWTIGRTAGRGLVERYGHLVLLTPHDLDRAEAWYERHPRWGVFGGRLVPVIRNFVALPAGVAEVPLVRFGLLTAAGSLIWDGAMAGIGYKVGGRWHAIVHTFSDAGYVLGALAVVTIAALVVHRWRSYGARTAISVTPGPPEWGGPFEPGGGGLAPAVVGLVEGDGGWAHGNWGPGEPGGDGLLRAGAGGLARDGAVEARAGGGVALGERPWPPVDATALVFEDALAPSTPGEHVAAWIGRMAEPGVGVGERNGPAANERLTAATGAVLFVLLLLEGLTVLRIGSLVTLHVVIGLILVPPVLVKIASTGWRFVRYYTGHPDYVRRGPPKSLLRVLAPFLILTTVVLFSSGIALVVVHHPLSWLYVVHRDDFVAWFAILAVHVLAYMWRVPGVLRRDLSQRRLYRATSPGSRLLRLWLVSGSILVGVGLATILWPSIAGHVHTFFHVR